MASQETYHQKFYSTIGKCYGYILYYEMRRTFAVMSRSSVFLQYSAQSTSRRGFDVREYYRVRSRNVDAAAALTRKTDQKFSSSLSVVVAADYLR